eukprot:s2528_g15.t1
MIPVFTRVLLPIWASALASGKKPFEVQRYVGTKKNAMKRLIKSALVIAGQKGSSSIVAIVRVFACCRDVTTHVKDQLIASLACDSFLQSNLAKYFQGDSFDVCYFDFVYDMRKFGLTWSDLESKTKRTFVRNCGFCLAKLSWEGHLFIQELLERPAAIKYKFTWPFLSVKDMMKMRSLFQRRCQMTVCQMTVCQMTTCQMKGGFPQKGAGVACGVRNEEANNARECLVPKIAALWLPSETPDIVDEVATMFAALWVLLRKAIEEQDLAENEEALKVFMSLCSIPTLFEGQPEGGGEASDLIAQAFRQNEKMGSDYSQIFSWDDPSQRKIIGKTLCQVLDGIMRGYDRKVDQEGVVVEQPVPKKRRGRRQSKSTGSKEEAVPVAQGESKPLEFGMPLSPEEHNSLITKLISVFESDMDEMKRAACDGVPKVSLEQLFQYRWVIQAWTQTVVHCAKADLDETNFQTVEQAVLRGDALDAQLALQVKLTLDQKQLETISSGYGVLGDCLDWITTHKKLALARQAKDVVSEHMKIYGPTMSVDGFETLPGDLQSLLGKLPPLADSGKRLFVFLLDFNVPNVSYMH